MQEMINTEIKQREMWEAKCSQEQSAMMNLTTDFNALKVS
jgi:hypothetical protein